MEIDKINKLCKVQFNNQQFNTRELKMNIIYHYIIMNLNKEDYRQQEVLKPLLYHKENNQKLFVIIINLYMEIHTTIIIIFHMIVL